MDWIAVKPNDADNDWLLISLEHPEELSKSIQFVQNVKIATITGCPENMSKQYTYCTKY